MEALSKAFAIRREYGWLVLFRRVLGTAGIRRVVLYRRGAEAATKDRLVTTPAAFGRLEENALQEYLDVRPDSDPTEIRSRLEAGDTCHTARSNGDIVATRWSSTREIEIGDLGVRSSLDPGQAYLYDAYTSPPFRRRGIAGALTGHIIRHLLNNGVQEVLSAAEPANPRGTGLNRSDGTPIATLVVIGRRRRRVIKLPPPRHRPRRS